MITDNRSTRSSPRRPSSTRAGERPHPGAGRLSVHDKIDICRGTFAFLVVLAHAFEVTWGIHDPSHHHVSKQFLDVLWATVGSGIFYVMGFFVISGYCIHLSVARLMEADRFPIKVYLVARLTRILPLYYAGLLFTVLVEWLIAAARPQSWMNGLNPPVLFAQLAVVQNLTQTYGSFAPSWSITNEVIYYAIYGLLAWCAARRADQPATIGMIWCLATAAVMEALYLTIARIPLVLSLGMLSGLGINWFLGALVAVHSRTLVQSRVVRVASHAWLPLLGAAMFLRARGRLPSQGVFLISGFAFTLMLVRFLCTDRVARASHRPRWADPAVRWLGLSSYPTYLFHGPILMLTGSALLRWGPISDWRLTWAILTGVGILTGVALGFLAEKPIMDWRSTLLRKLKGSTSGPAPRLPASVLGIQR